MRKGSLLLFAMMLVAIQACSGGPSGSSISGSGASAGESLIGPAISSLAPSSTITDPQALGFFSSQGFADCYPGGSINYSSFESFHSDAVQGEISKPLAATARNSSTSDPTIATVANGVVTCVAAGTVKITATIPNATCEISGCGASAYAFVGPAEHTLTLSPSSGTFHVGDTVAFTAALNTVTPDGKVTTQDVTSSIARAGGGVELADSLIGSGKPVLAVAATSATTNNIYKAANVGTSWGFVAYTVPGSTNDIVQSNVVTITVQ